MKRTIEAYKFSELSPKIKAKVLDSERDSNTGSEYWSDSIVEDFISVAKCFGFEIESDDIRFSGFGSQGDGASFTCRVNVKYWQSAHKSAKRLKGYAPSDKVLHAIHKRYQQIAKGLTGITEETVDIYRNSSRYSHECTVSAVINDETDTTPKHLDSYILDEAQELMKWLYKQLEKEYDYLRSDQAVTETIEANEYLFSVSGQMIGHLLDEEV